MPDILRTVSELRAFTAARRGQGRRIALVPTMGALHDGHMELVRRGHEMADDVIATIFVNPAQFGPHEDFSAYPRTWDADIERLAAHNAAAVYYPDVATMYPPGFSTAVTLAGIAEPLEGEHRPGHFTGVATVVAKLLLQSLPDVALFGEKDWQQLQVITRMATDLDLPVQIVGVPTVRDQNGLALSSRNAYLSPAQYKIALSLNTTLRLMGEKFRYGLSAPTAENWGRDQLLTLGFDSVDYIALRDAVTLSRPGRGPVRALVAARLGAARLIDNMAV